LFVVMHGVRIIYTWKVRRGPVAPYEHCCQYSRKVENKAIASDNKPFSQGDGKVGRKGRERGGGEGGREREGEGEGEGGMEGGRGRGRERGREGGGGERERERERGVGG
jgi:hypothetical protein